MNKIKSIISGIDKGASLFETYSSSILFAVLFLVFIINVVFRYFFKAILWAHELSLLCFVWIAILGGCYANRTDENIKFDTFYANGSEKRKCILDIIGSVLVVSTFTISFFPSLDYIIFLNFEMSDTLPVRKSFIFCVYLYFLVSMIWQYATKLITSITKLIAIKRGAVTK